MNKPTQIVENPGHYEDPEEEGQMVSTDVGILVGAEIDSQVMTAKRFPRSLKAFRDTMIELVTLDETVAASCIYAVPRDGKIVEGPSARFAEAVASCWGNNRTGGRIVGTDEEFVTGQGFFFDLEKNAAITYDVKRSIVGKHGRFNNDMIRVAGAAAASIAHRNAVLKGVPKALWIAAYEKAKAVVAGNQETLHNRRMNMLKQLALCGATSAQVFGLLGVKGIDDIGLAHMVSLAGIYTAIKEGSLAVEEAFAPEKMKGDAGETLTPPRPSRSEFKRETATDAGKAQGGQSTAASEGKAQQAEPSQQQQQQVSEAANATTHTDATVTKGGELNLQQEREPGVDDDDSGGEQVNGKRDPYADWFDDQKKDLAKVTAIADLVPLRERVKADIAEDSPYMAEWLALCATKQKEIKSKAAPKK